MIIKIIVCIVIVGAVGIIAHTIAKKLEQKKTSVSFEEAMNLLDLPLVTVFVNRKKLNLIVDTGCDTSCLSKFGQSIAQIKSTKSSSTSVGADGKAVQVQDSTLDFTLKKHKYSQHFTIREGLDEAFAIVKQECGVQLHGLLGSDFLNTHNYVIDYKDHILYKK